MGTALAIPPVKPGKMNRKGFLKERNRILVGYVGEDGIKADTPYVISVTKSGKASWKGAVNA